MLQPRTHERPAVPLRYALGVIALMLCGASAPAQAHSRRGAELQSRLFSPCCYTQTLDIHESELADKLRSEIERRLAAGEPALQIEDDLVARFGERIRAVPRDSDPRSQIPLLVGAGLGLALIGLAGFALRWQRKPQGDALRHTEPADAQTDRKYDLELDAALRRANQDEPPALSA